MASRKELRIITQKIMQKVFENQLSGAKVQKEGVVNASNYLVLFNVAGVRYCRKMNQSKSEFLSMK